MVWLPDGEKKSADTIDRFDRIHELVRRRDGRTDGWAPHDGIGRACIASRGKTYSTKGVKNDAYGRSPNLPSASCDASRLSVVSFNSTIRRAQSSVISYFRFRFIAA